MRRNACYRSRLTKRLDGMGARAGDPPSPSHTPMTETCDITDIMASAFSYLGNEVIYCCYLYYVYFQYILMTKLHYSYNKVTTFLLAFFSRLQFGNLPFGQGTGTSWDKLRIFM